MRRSWSDGEICAALIVGALVLLVAGVAWWAL